MTTRTPALEPEMTIVDVPSIHAIVHRCSVLHRAHLRADRRRGHDYRCTGRRTDLAGRTRQIHMVLHRPKVERGTKRQQGGVGTKRLPGDVSSVGPSPIDTPASKGLEK